MEHDLREAHATETQNVATALKYMEAYCLGPNPEYTEVVYVVTDEDRKKLQRQRTLQQKLPAKHDSAINVLRAKQERDTAARIQKQRLELEQLDSDYAKSKAALELQFAHDARRLAATIQSRRDKLTRWWNLKFEIWRRKWEKESGCALLGEIPHEAWPEAADAHDVAIDPASPLAAYLGSSAGVDVRTTFLDTDTDDETDASSVLSTP